VANPEAVCAFNGRPRLSLYVVNRHGCHERSMLELSVLDDRGWLPTLDRHGSRRYDMIGRIDDRATGRLWRSLLPAFPGRYDS
jgi:hypothetical protein